MTIYIYSNETGEQAANYSGETNAQCEQWASDNYGFNDYHWSYSNMQVS